MESFGLDPIKIRADLIHSCGAYFEDRMDQPSLCHIRGLRILIRDTADLYLTDEIFRGYSYPIPFQEPVAVFDIGMNVGMAALEFAQNPWVEIVYGFEPFPRTYQMAIENFDLNPDARRKIIAQCFGMSLRSESRDVEYSETLRAGMTTRGVPAGPFSPGNIKKEKIELREVSEVLRPLLNLHRGKKLILKMDCEGDEFDLIPRLSETKLLDAFDLLMIEFHRKSPDELLEILETHGYESTGAVRAEQILFQGKEGNMIYAAKDGALLE